MLEISSNTIRALGIFGRLSNEQEVFFDALENKYSKKSETGVTRDVFRHLTLTFIRDASISDVREQLDLLRELKKYLPLRLNVKKAFVKDEVSIPGEQHIALEFGLEPTQKLVEYVKKIVGEEKTVATWYTKVVWFVPKENHQIVIEELKGFKELVFTDFYLVSNKQDDENTIYTTTQFFKPVNKL